MSMTNAGILTIGDEILIGQIIDTNSVFIAKHLNINGINVNEIASIGDTEQAIVEQLDFCLERNDIVIITGGLGPTKDDITKQCLANYFKTDLVLNSEVLDDIKNFVASRNIEMNQSNVLQAHVPRNCEIMRNHNGTAPGMWFNKNGKVVISLPAVPFEMKPLFTQEVLPRLQKTFNLKPISHRTILTYGIPESRLSELLEDWEAKYRQDIKLAYLPSPERLRLRLSPTKGNYEIKQPIMNEAVDDLHKLIGNEIYGEGNIFLQDIVFNLLKTNNKSLALAESCTGGYISSLITSIPGSSKIYNGGVVAYSNSLKENLLDVEANLINQHGAVSEEVAKAMATGVLNKLNSDYAIAVSGLAGPDRGTPTKPVGTTCIAVANRNEVVSQTYKFGKRRDINIRYSASTALNMLRKLLLKDFKVNL